MARSRFALRGTPEPRGRRLPPGAAPLRTGAGRGAAGVSAAP
jgi:hypothetical protein